RNMSPHSRRARIQRTMCCAPPGHHRPRRLHLYEPPSPSFGLSSPPPEYDLHGGQIVKIPAIGKRIARSSNVDLQPRYAKSASNYLTARLPSGGFFSWRRNGTTGWVFRLADGTPTRREGAYGAQLDIADPASHATASRLADPQAEAGRYEGCGRAATDRPADDERPTW